MAKPPDNSDIPHSPFIISDPHSFSSARTPASRKRLRGSDDDPADVAEDSQKTRRVNPQRLAARLGADLVAEMEALIFPGAKMPSFEVRRVIQERYGVDRRHIYDYFHSRGLRVAKEDRHTNLTRGRASKALARQLIEKGGSSQPPPDSDTAESPLMEHQPAENQAIVSKATPIKLKLKFKPSLEAPEYLSFRSAKRVAVQRISGLNLGRRRQTPSRDASSSGANKHIPQEARHGMASALPVPTDVHASFPARTPSPCPEFTVLDKSPYCPSAAPHLPEFHLSSELFLEHDMMTDYSLDIALDNCQRDPLANIEEYRPLTQMERLELYNLINNNIGTSGGIEECAGTYRAYMKERSRHYFDRISFKASYGTRIYRVHHGEPRSGSKAMGDDVRIDFQKWLSGPDEKEQHLMAARLEPKYTEGYLAPRRPQAPAKLLLSSDSPLVPSQLDVNPRETRLDTDTRDLPSSEPADCTRASPLGKAPSIALSALHDEYSIDLSPKPRAPPLFERINEGRHIQATEILHASMFHRRRHSSRLQPSSFALAPSMEALRCSITISDSNATSSIASFPSGFVDTYSCSPDGQNAIRSGLNVSRPIRVRTTSAAGGI